MAEPAAATNTQGTRVIGRPFEKGNRLSVANKGGRPRGIERRTRELCGDNGELLVQLMVDQATGWRFMVNPAVMEADHFDLRTARANPANWEAVTAAEQQAAIRWCADRGYGKVKDFVNIEIEPTESGPDIRVFSTDFRAAVDELSARRRQREDAEAESG
jgi:hypothetical protein